MTTTSNFGPLTTTFTPPADCFSEKWVLRNANNTVLNWGATCDAGKRGFATSCYPPGWQGQSNNNTNLPYQAFSPGLACPSGFRGTFSVSNTKNNLMSAYVTSLSTNEEATVCCPNGYAFGGGDYCTKGALQLSSREFYSKSNSQCVTTTVPGYAGKLPSSTAEGGHDARLQAMPVILVRNTVNDPLPSESSGLSTGAKIAIGICIPVGVILIAAGIFIFFHRRKRARRALEAGPMQKPSAPVTESHDSAAFGGKPELDAIETGHGNANVFKQELEGNEINPGVPGAPAELAVYKSPATPVAELPGDVMMGDLSRVRQDVSRSELSAGVENGDLSRNPSDVSRLRESEDGRDGSMDGLRR